jgi:hypothetical protein
MRFRHPDWKDLSLSPITLFRGPLGLARAVPTELAHRRPPINLFQAPRTQPHSNLDFPEPKDLRPSTRKIGFESMEDKRKIDLQVI